MRTFTPRSWKFLAAGVIAVIILILYAPALRMSWYADDYEFLERAGRMDWLPYLRYYTNEYAYFRPIQYIVLKIEYDLFGANPAPYHAVQLLLHVLNSVLFCTIVSRTARRWQLGFLAALAFAALPVIHLDIFWIAVADPLSTFFYLLTLLFWLIFLESGRRVFFGATCVGFIVAVMTKEMNATLLVTMALLQQWVMKDRTHAKVRQPYFLLGSIWLIYFAYAFAYQSERAPAGNPNPLPGFFAHAVSGFLPYLTNLVAPWGLPEPWSYVWLVICAAFWIYLVRTRRNLPLLFLGIHGLLVVAPLLPFLCGCGRYLYLPLLVTAVLIALIADAIPRAFAPRRLYLSALVAGLLSLLLSAEAIAIDQSAEQFAGFVRENREPVRIVAAAHPRLPGNTLIYFVDPPVPLAFLSGQFFLRYGAQVTVADGEKPVEFRKFSNAYVYLRDEDGKWREIQYAAAEYQITPAFPISFAANIQLQDMQIVQARARRADRLVIILAWRATGKIGEDYTVFVHLVDERGDIIAQQDAPPKNGNAPTSSWRTHQVVVDEHQLIIPVDAPLGSNYRLEVGLYLSATLERLLFISPNGNRGDSVTITPISIEN